MKQILPVFLISFLALVNSSNIHTLKDFQSKERLIPKLPAEVELKRLAEKQPKLKDSEHAKIEPKELRMLNRNFLNKLEASSAQSSNPTRESAQDDDLPSNKRRKTGS